MKTVAPTSEKYLHQEVLSSMNSAQKSLTSSQISRLSPGKRRQDGYKWQIHCVPRYEAPYLSLLLDLHKVLYCTYIYICFEAVALVHVKAVLGPNKVFIRHQLVSTTS